MPTVSYECRTCGNGFKQMVMRGEEDRVPPCPECGGRDIRIFKPDPGLFNGIARFSALGSDTN